MAKPREEDYTRRSIHVERSDWGILQNDTAHNIVNLQVMVCALFVLVKILQQFQQLIDIFLWIVEHVVVFASK
jgi:hypothetical protein